jgi:hypothetical protein
MTASWAKEVGFGSAVSHKYGRIVVARYRPKIKPRVVSGSTRHGGMQDKSSMEQSSDDTSNEPGTEPQRFKGCSVGVNHFQISNFT